ncbi:MAG: DUF1592 domain-containing protein [Planctomycetota bacterium]
MARFFASSIALGLICLIGRSDGAPPEPISETHYVDVVRPVLVKYCGDCHSEESEDVGFLRAFSKAEIGHDQSLWASVAEQLTNRTMPPADEAQPTEAERLETATWINKHLQETACDLGLYVGSPVQRRLNREQYEYAVEDLTGLEFDFVETFPADSGGGEGFNNNGELLFLPPLLLERYLEVARSITDRMIALPRLKQRFVAPDGLYDKDDLAGYQLVESVTDDMSPVTLHHGQRAVVQTTIFESGDYEIRTRISSPNLRNAEIVIEWNGKKLSTINPSGKQKVLEDRRRLRLDRGVHVFFWKNSTDASATLIDVRLEQVSPASDEQLSATKQLFAAGQSDLEAGNHIEAMRKVLSKFARLAWRRRITEEESKRFEELYLRGSRRGEPFEQAIKLPLQAILVSPNFLFISETQKIGDGDHRLSPIELASRLSFFLWHSLPDDELLTLAEDGRLQKRQVLANQIRRMLADPRSKRFAKGFAGQWLGTEAVGRTKIPDTNFFRPAYSAELVVDLRRQVSETMHWMLREDLPITDWLGAEAIVVNKRLAEHYGIKEVPNPEDDFITIAQERSARSSVLGMGAVHMLTSYSRRTSPVLRGGWVLETIFGVHLPAPPPDAGDLPGGEKENEKKTVRERLEAHRRKPTCAACHDLIDPIGFGLENYDVLGRFRQKEGKNDIDAAGRLPSGETFDGPDQLRALLISRCDDFREQYCRKMLGYALARSLTDGDACTINQITEKVRQHDDRSVALIEAIVFSHPFQYRQGVSP